MTREEVVALFDLYETLLTEKQQEYIRMYYFLDFSMVEIADSFDISRSAVSDNLKKVIKHLETYESQLKLLEKQTKRNEIIEKLKDKYSNDPLLKKLEEI